MLSYKMYTQIDLLCYSCVSHLFACMVNPLYRGPNFKWEDFPKMAQAFCSVQRPYSLEFPAKNSNEAELYLFKVAEMVAKRLIVDSGVKDVG